MEATLATLLGAVVFLALMAGLFVPLEALAPIDRRVPPWRALAAGGALFIFNTLLVGLIGGPILDGLAALRSPAAPTPVLLVAVFILSDVAGYLIHRAMHHVPLLWRWHAVHHAPAHVSWIVAWRQHPVDFLLHSIAVGVPGALLGASLSDVASVVVLRKAFTTFLHANVRVRLGVVEQLIASPAFHRLHHSADPVDHDRNFAGTFPWIDRLFGTYRRPRNEWTSDPGSVNN